MFEWRINQIQLGFMEKVLNHMERQGFEVQNIIPIQLAKDKEQEVILAGKRKVDANQALAPRGLPALTDMDMNSIYAQTLVSKERLDQL